LLLVRIALITMLCLLALPAAASASPRQVMSFEAPRELLDDARRDRTLDEIQRFGVTQVRQLVYWRDFAPGAKRKRKPRGFDASDPDEYPKLGRVDNLLAAAEARDIEVMLTLTGPVPRWATKKRKGHRYRPSAKEFGRFATAVGRRYGDRVSTWSIWNEPNQPQFLKPQYRKGRPVSPKLYRGLYRAAYRGIRRTRENRRDDILIGETSPRGNENVVHPLAFLRGMLCLDKRYRQARGCGRLPADGYAHHAYTTRTGPRFVPPDSDDVTIGVISRLVRALDRAGRAGGLPRRLDIYLTEFGIQSHPDRVSGVSRSRQPAYYAISEHIAYVNPRVALFSQYLMADDAPRESGPRFGGFESGLRRSNGRRKPAYRAFANPLAVENYGRTDVLWGLIRPQRSETEVTIEVKRRRGSDWALLDRLTTTSTGVFGLDAQHRDGQRYRVRWTDASGREHVGPAIRAYRVRTR
jgi:Cellulase (glycosyl hydrolase family 5)